jgi:hypothetical protein
MPSTLRLSAQVGEITAHRVCARINLRRITTQLLYSTPMETILKLYSVAVERAMVRLPFSLKYLAKLSTGKIVLWCYLIWYLVTVVAHFEASPGLWLSSLGMSAIVGLGLLLSIQIQPLIPSNRWQTFRLFLMPFCVSSFSALTKGRGTSWCCHRGR